MKQLDLTSKTAVVTGGAGQIGRAICRALADCGANVAINYYSQEDYARKLSQRLETECHVKSVAIKADITDKKSIEVMKKEINEKLKLHLKWSNHKTMRALGRKSPAQKLAEFLGQNIDKRGVKYGKILINALICINI